MDEGLLKKYKEENETQRANNESLHDLLFSEWLRTNGITDFDYHNFRKYISTEVRPNTQNQSINNPIKRLLNLFSKWPLWEKITLIIGAMAAAISVYIAWLTYIKTQ